MAKGADDFTKWLSDVVTKYKTLEGDQRIKLLDHLIDNSEGGQLFYLSKKLNVLLKRDFIGELPIELVHRILPYLDTRALLQCCCVSKQWCQSISTCTDVWKKVCMGAGLSIHDEFHDAFYYKNRYMQCSMRLKSLNEGTAFEQKVLFGHRDRVMALYYKGGKLATGSDDHTVRIWDCETGQCIKIFQTHTVADVKFDENIVITGSFDTTVASWDFETGKLLQQFTGHVAAVFSVDYCLDLDLLISGSADSTVKIWSLSQGHMIRTLPQHRSTWIMQVRLISIKQDDSYYILSRDNTTSFVWKISKKNNDLMDFFEWMNPDSDLVPGMQVKDKTVSFATLDIQGTKPGPNIKETCSVVEYDIGPEGRQRWRKSSVIGKDMHVQSFLGCGKCYDVILTQGDVAGVDIIRQADQMRIGSVTLPHDYRQSKRGSTYCLGEQNWMDGFDGENDSGLFFATSLRDNTVLLISWSHQRKLNDDKLTRTSLLDPMKND